ncbi:GNAT family N-acetyltransferase [Taibaiella soli]|uniref:GNAT family N-acetyltransferase n=1 Tax=Taibaiella soli TaxID=1649169 RepID=A0A2W2ASK2_9BACT|nr:GNAT family N-acetyltransferase [Taibaiella soli]PZF70924.1 GNAT family N-acetyltransferase [Taibaiella soli]
MIPQTLEYNGYLITTDKSLMKPEQIHEWLANESYWAQHVPYETVKTAFDNSFTIGILKDGEQIGYARLVTDYAVFAYLADVFVKEAHRGQGLSKKMMQFILELDWVKHLRRIMLATMDAHGLYEQFGFTEPKFPKRLMEITKSS